MSQPVNGLGLGITAPYMNTAFILGGLLIMIRVVGIFQSIREMSRVTRWICIGLLSLTGLGMILDGIFKTVVLAAR